MAKNYFLLLLLLTASASFAQVKIGLIGGPQSANITEKNNIPGWDTASGRYYSPKSGFHIGIISEIPFGAESRFYFQPAVLYTQKGRNYVKSYQFSSSDTFNTYYTNQTLAIQYIDIPLNIAYKLPLSHKKTSNFLLSAGPYISLFYSGKKTTNENDQFSSSTESSNNVVNTNQDLEVGKKDDSYRTVGYGFNGRAGFEFGNVTLTGFYSQGLDNLYYAPYKGTFNHKVYGASLGIWLGQIKEPAPVIKDKDNDGIPDNKDACPLLPGTAITNGCPDKDGDGIADIKDKCPDVAGTIKYGGCPIPDTDNDGINDEEDKCPTIPGVARYKGCPVPDKDHDGINDEEDKCPDVAGVARYYGCPVPDKDNDGVNDEEDKCPDVAGTVENGGCPVIKEEIKKQVSFAAENIFFLLNSAQLTNKSFAPLDTVAKILKANPSISITVNGYTDNTGTAAANMPMSAKRAQAVKNYLVKKGVEEARVATNGYGQADPVADNKTGEGRTKNRRVELKLK
ncbi:MAG: OmpA family protein [Bacteroidota bacterium]